MTAVRDNLVRVARAGNGAHAGLIFGRYLEEQTEDGKKRLFDHTLRACRNAQGIYRLAWDRWLEETRDLTSALFRVQTRLITGLGAKGVLETGIRLHHTYGIPLIPGSGLKGTVAHYCREAYPESPDFPAAEVRQALFGTAGNAGHIRFQDAWMMPDSLTANGEGLLRDVMTSHHPKYYAGDSIAPHDGEDPNPVAFLSVRGRFRVVVECDVPGPEGARWSAFALQLLEEALKTSGVGGKTSSGYGRLKPDKPSAKSR